MRWKVKSKLEQFEERNATMGFSLIEKFAWFPVKVVGPERVWLEKYYKLKHKGWDMGEDYVKSRFDRERRHTFSESKIGNLPQPYEARHIQSMDNQEARGFLIKVYGIEKYTQEMGETVVAQDETGELVVISGNRFVKVKNSTPEKDGTCKTYYLGVPPDIFTARGGVAWTFGMKEREYQPLQQT